jgi:hypothetical protein
VSKKFEALFFYKKTVNILIRFTAYIQWFVGDESWRSVLQMSDDFVLIGKLNQTYNAVSPGFSENVFTVGFYCFLTDEERPGNLPVIVFFFDQADDFFFPVGKMDLI